MTKRKFNSKELLEMLNYAYSCKEVKKREPLPKFTLAEYIFIRDLIFIKPKDLVYFYIANNIVWRTEIGRMGMFGGADYRRLLFFLNFFKYKGNSTKTAIACGYSPRSAKSQGHRLLRYMQNCSRNKIG